MKNKEIRNYEIMEFRIEKRDDEKRIISGHAAVFNKLSEDLGGFREQIAPGAFDDVIQNDDVRALFNHDPNFVLGRNRAGTLRMKEDSIGLDIEIDMPDTQFARDLTISMERGDINQMSFGFRVAEQAWEEKEDGSVIRTITKLERLYDVSPVTYPAYPQTDVAVRSLESWKEDHKKSRQADAWKIEQMLIRQKHLEADI